MEKYPDFNNVYHLEQLNEKIRVFKDREDAGKVLSGMLSDFVDSSTLILGIPAGGVPVASIIAEDLGLELDVAVVSKITLPWNTEAGYGAVAFNGTTGLNEPLIKRIGLSRELVNEGIQKTSRKVKHRMQMLRGQKPLPDLKEKTVILVDDGIASGFTMLVALEALSKLNAKQLMAAIPTGHLQAIRKIIDRTEAVFCPNIRSGGVFAVADAYKDWSDVSEHELLDILNLQLEK
ncbi:MAG: phosphoribosyltransferase family protein [Desulfobacterales bacterium]